MQSGDLARLAELLRSAARRGDAAPPAAGVGELDAALVSRLFVRRRSEGDERMRPRVGMSPAWERLSGVITPPRGGGGGGGCGGGPQREGAGPAVAAADGATTGVAAAADASPPKLADAAPSAVARPLALRPSRPVPSSARLRQVVGASDFAGLTALHHAARLKRADMVKLLLDFGADADTTTPAGLTALHCAAENDGAEAALMLLEHGADVHTRETLTWQPIHCASWNGATPTAVVLVAHGADPRSHVDGDRCAVLLAREKGHGDVESLLLSSLRPFLHRDPWHPATATVERMVLAHVALCARRAAARGLVPNLPPETVLIVFSFFKRRDLWRIGVVLREYRPGFWHLPRLTVR